MRLRSLPGRATRLLQRVSRKFRRIDEKVAHLPARAPEPIGRALLSYIVDPFLAPAGRPIPHSHTHYWESWAMGHELSRLGFAVDVLHWTNTRFEPVHHYDLLIDPRHNLERLAPCVGADCVKVFHAETAHWRVNDAAQLRRLRELEERRGIHLSRTRLVGENRGIESADCAVVLGNAWTLASYEPFGKPLYRVPLSNPFTYPSPANQDFDARRSSFVWFGGVGFVHKGLDRVLEAFAGAPELELEVAAPLDREPDFVDAYERELYRTPNIHALGWVDVATPKMTEMARRNLGMVFPSCSEGGGGSAITAMHVGLIPLLTAEASVDLDPTYGVLLPDAGVDTIRAAVRELAARPAERLREMAVRAWNQARAVHTRDQFRSNYRHAAIAILERFRPDLAERIQR